MKFTKLLLAASLAVALGVATGHALDFTVSVSTVNPKTSATTFTQSGAPHISGGAIIDMIVFSTTDTVSGTTVDIYDTATASHTATLAFQFFVKAATNTASGFAPTVIRWPDHNPLKLTNPAFSTSGANTGSVRLNVNYR